ARSSKNLSLGRRTLGSRVGWAFAHLGTRSASGKSGGGPCPHFKAPHHAVNVLGLWVQRPPRENVHESAVEAAGGVRCNVYRIHPVERLPDDHVEQGRVGRGAGRGETNVSPQPPAPSPLARAGKGPRR